ncbi:M56 family metallopeptidase [Spirosoma arcticum]
METLRYVVLVNGLLAVVSAAFYALLRRETFFEANRLVLWLGLMVSLVLPLLELPDWRPQPVRAVMQRTARVIVPRVLPSPPVSQPDVTITFPNGPTYPAFPQQVITSDWSWQQGLLGLYVAVVIMLLIRFGVRLLSLMRLIWQSVHEPYDDFTLLRNDAVTSPFSFFGWVVLNPDHHEPDELEQILRHERVHVRAWHSVDMIGAELVSIIFWFNPAAYLFRQMVHQTVEFSADRAVLAEGIDPKAYQYNLVKVSLSAGWSTINNHFSYFSLRHRVGMMNRQRSSYRAWGRYAMLGALLIGVGMLACRHKREDDQFVMKRINSNAPLTNSTRRLAAELDAPGMPWIRQSALFGKVQNEERTEIINGRRVVIIPFTHYPSILCLRNDRLALKLPDGERAKVFINGQQSESPEKALSALRFEEVADLFVYQKWDDAAGAEKYPESYRIFISTTHKTPVTSPRRSQWAKYLKAAAVSDYPLGKASTFSMNKLLEATFFSNKLTFVKRTKDDHLTLYDDYKTDVDLYINGLPVKPKDIESVHVREVDRLYANERSFEEWVDGTDRKRRFVLYIQTTPKRAKRDSTYYVFSPFYSGDF